MELPESIETTDVRAADGTYTVMVNDMPLHTPKGHPVLLLSWELANALADELMSTGRADLQPVTLYSLYATQRDFIEARVESTIGVILQHLAGDFVLYPDADLTLAAVQLAAWAPMLACWRDLGAEVPIAKPLQEAQIPWEVRESLQAQLAAMNPAQLTVVVQTMTNLGSVTLGLCLVQGTITAEQAVAALSVTVNQTLSEATGGDVHQDPFVAGMRRTVRRLLQYAQLSG